MGKAIILEDCDFSQLNLGQVTFVDDTELQSLEINGESSAIGVEEQYEVMYNPSYTTQRRVVWSIESGSQYATIDQNGLLTILQGADNNNVTIKVESLDKPNVSATKTITVTYYQPIQRNLLIVGPSMIEGDVRAGNYFILDMDTMKQVVGTSAEVVDDYKEYLGAITWNVVSGSNFASFENGSGTEGVLDIIAQSDNDSVEIAVLVDNTTKTKSITVTQIVTDLTINTYQDLVSLKSAIENATESSLVASATNGGGFANCHIRMTADIDCENNIPCIGIADSDGASAMPNSRIFKGWFDGGAHTLTMNGTTNTTSTWTGGLFDGMYGGKLSNLRLSGTVTLSKKGGGLVGIYAGGTKFERIFSELNVTATSTSFYVGCVLGTNSNNVQLQCDIEDCISCGNVSNVGDSSLFAFGGADNANKIAVFGSLVTTGGSSGDRMVLNINQVSTQMDINYANILNIGSINSYNTKNLCSLVSLEGGTYTSEQNNISNVIVAAQKSGGKVNSTIVLGKSDSVLTLNNCYYDENIVIDAVGTRYMAYNGISKSIAELKSGNLTLSEEWIQKEGFYPMFDSQFIVESIILDRIKNGYVA